MRETTVQIRVSHLEKAGIEAKAQARGMTPSDYLRTLGLNDGLPPDQQFSRELDKAREAVENDPANLNATLDEKGSVVAEDLLARDKRIENDLDAKDAFFAKRIPELRARMSSRNAEATARKEWEEGDA